MARPETRFRLSAKRTNPFKSAGASVQSTTGSRGVRISGSNAGYTMFRGSARVLATHSIRQFSPSLPLLCVTVCHHISTGLYLWADPFIALSKSCVSWNCGFEYDLGYGCVSFLTVACYAGLYSGSIRRPCLYLLGYPKSLVPSDSKGAPLWPLTFTEHSKT
jgi:hypothetical protein